jgi:hypothetical protein
MQGNASQKACVLPSRLPTINSQQQPRRQAKEKRGVADALQPSPDGDRPSGAQQRRQQRAGFDCCLHSRCRYI